MNITRVCAIFMRQWFLIKGNPTRLFNIFVWMAIDVMLWGYMSKYLSTFGQATFGLVTVLLGAIILWEFLTRIQQGIMTAFLEDVWSQNFVNYFASPLQMKEYLAGLVLTSLMTSIFAFVIVTVIAIGLFGYSIFKVGLLILPFLLVLLLFGMSIGFFVTTIIFRFGPSAEWYAWPIPFLLSIVSGVYYPVSTLPPALQAAAKIFPSSYVFESFRSIIANGGFSAELGRDLAIATLLALAYLYGAYRLFLAAYHRNLKTGGIARFSAE